MARFKFNSRSQHEDESVDQFTTELRLMANNYEFGELKDSLIGVRIICGTRDEKATGLILAGLGLAALGFAGRYAFRAGRIAQKTLNEKIGAIPQGGAFSKYYRGGFDPKMNKREASLILGVSPSASNIKIKEAHKRIMLLNHPDRGGSPYLAAKINEAKDYLDKAKRGSS